MATDRYGNTVADSFMDSQPSYKDYTSMRRTVEKQKQNAQGGDGESRGYDGSSDFSGKDISKAMGIGAKAAKFGGMDFGFGMSSAIGAAQTAARTGDLEAAATAGVKGLGKEAFGMIGGPVGMLGKAGIDIATAESPAHAAASIGLGTVGSMLGGMLGMAVAGPIGAYAGAKLGSMASQLGVEWGASAIGDATDSRDKEASLDALEDAGWSYGESAAAMSSDADADTKGTGATGEESARTELGRASGDSGYGGEDADGSGMGGGRDSGAGEGHGGGSSSDADAGAGGGTGSGDSGDNDGHGE